MLTSLNFRRPRVPRNWKERPFRGRRCMRMNVLNLLNNLLRHTFMLNDPLRHMLPPLPLPLLAYALLALLAVPPMSTPPFPPLMLAVISPIPLLSSPSIPFTHDATQPALPSPECPALTTSLSAIASSELATAIVDANGILEVVARNNGKHYQKPMELSMEL